MHRCAQTASFFRRPTCATVNPCTVPITEAPYGWVCLLLFLFRSSQSQQRPLSWLPAHHPTLSISPSTATSTRVTTLSPSCARHLPLQVFGLDRRPARK